MATNNCLVTNILHNLILCSTEKKKLIHVWNNLRVSKWWHFYSFFLLYGNLKNVTFKQTQCTWKTWKRSKNFASSYFTCTKKKKTLCCLILQIGICSHVILINDHNHRHTGFTALIFLLLFSYSSKLIRIPRKWLISVLQNKVDNAEIKS